MKKIIIFVVTLVAALSLVACSGDSGNQNNTGTGNEQTGNEQANSQSGPIIIGSTSAPRTLNPLYFPSRQDSLITNMIFDNFVEPNAEGIIEGRLVDSYDISEDGLTYTFNLVNGINWHDGEAFDGEDVVATFELISRGDYNGGVSRTKEIVGVEEFANGTEEHISGITLSEDKMTVTVQIQSPSATFLPGLYIPILPEHHIKNFNVALLEEEEFNQNPVGTGPFKFESWVVDTSVTVVKNNEYYLGEPKVDSIIVKFGDAVALTTQLETGQIDMLEVDKDGYATFEGNSNFNINTYPMTSVSYIGFRTAPGRAEDTIDFRPVFSKNIRQALAYSTEKEALVDAAYGALGYAHDSIFPQGSLGDSDNDNPYNYDLDKARALIEEEGFVFNNSTGFYEKNGETLNVELLYAESSAAVAAIIKEQWKEAGVDVSLSLLDFGALIDVLLRKSDENGNIVAEGDNISSDAAFDAYLLGFAQESDPGEYAQYFTDDPFWNFYHYANEDVNQWFAEQGVETDQVKRSEILKKISEQVTEDLPWFTYAGSNETVVSGTNIGGFNPDGRGYTMNAHTWEFIQ